MSSFICRKRFHIHTRFMNRVEKLSVNKVIEVQRNSHHLLSLYLPSIIQATQSIQFVIFVFAIIIIIMFVYNFQDELTDVDFIPPPPPPLRRNHSFTRHYPRSIPSNNIQIGDCTATATINCAGSGTSPGFMNTNEIRTKINKPDLCEYTKNDDDKHKYSYSNKVAEATTPDRSMIPNGYCGKKYQQYIVDENYLQHLQNKESNNSFYLYHQEPPQYPQSFESQQQNIPGKFNTIGPSSCRTKIHANKYHTSNCNLNQFDNSNLLNGRYFSNSMTNFNFNQSHGHYNKPTYNNQYHGLGIGGGGNTTLIGDSYNSMTSIGTPKQQIQQQKGMPWRHRQCPSTGSSSSGTSTTRKQNYYFIFILNFTYFALLHFTIASMLQMLNRLESFILVFIVQVYVNSKYAQRQRRL